ncbi:MAG: hypothetical protein AAF490_06285 [Chloroflexota bacterium]
MLSSALYSSLFTTLIYLVVITIYFYHLQGDTKQPVQLRFLFRSWGGGLSIFTVFFVYGYREEWREPIFGFIYLAAGLLIWIYTLRLSRSYRNPTQFKIHIPQKTYNSLAFAVCFVFYFWLDFNDFRVEESIWRGAGVFLQLTIISNLIIKIFLPTYFSQKGILDFPYPTVNWETVYKVTWSTTSRNKVIIHYQRTKNHWHQTSEFIIPRGQLNDTYMFLAKTLPHLNIPLP